MLPEVHTDGLKHVGVQRLHKILYIYIYIYVVHLLVWIINCTKCTVHTSNHGQCLPKSYGEHRISLTPFKQNR